MFSGKCHLKRLLEAPPDPHHLSDGLHGAADFGGDALELGQVPPGYLDHAVVQARFEAGRGLLGHAVD